MTLNTFHFAGHGAANVTLGIPRLREIVMTASQDIKTPMMRLPIVEAVSDSRLKTFCQSSTRLTLSQCVDNVVVEERLTPKTSDNNYSRSKLYTVKLNLFPRADYEAEYSVSPEQILAGIAKTFVPLLDKAIAKEIKQNDRESSREAAEVGQGKQVRKGGKGSASGADEDGAGEEDAGVVGRGDGEEIDGDADDERRGRQANDEQTYDDEDEDEAPDAEDELEAKFKDADDAASADGDSSDDEADDEDPEVVARRSKAESLERMKQYERRVPGTSRFVNKLVFDKEGGESCELDLEVRPIFFLHSPRRRRRRPPSGADPDSLLPPSRPRPLAVLVAGAQAPFGRHRRGGVPHRRRARGARHRALLRREGRQRQRRRAPQRRHRGRQPASAVADRARPRRPEPHRNERRRRHPAHVRRRGGEVVHHQRDVGRLLGLRHRRRLPSPHHHRRLHGAHTLPLLLEEERARADPVVSSILQTCEGGYKPFNRTGLSNSSSAMLKASFVRRSFFPTVLSSLVRSPDLVPLPPSPALLLARRKRRAPSSLRPRSTETTTT